MGTSKKLWRNFGMKNDLGTGARIREILKRRLEQARQGVIQSE
jgi:hypothetical protein